jgi:hypothetical protein
MMKVMMVWYFVSQTLVRSWQYSIYHCVHFGFVGTDAVVTFIKKFCAFWRYVPILKCIVDFLCLHIIWFWRDTEYFCEVCWPCRALIDLRCQVGIACGSQKAHQVWPPTTSLQLGKEIQLLSRGWKKVSKFLHICEVSELWKNSPCSHHLDLVRGKMIQQRGYYKIWVIC